MLGKTTIISPGRKGAPIRGGGPPEAVAGKPEGRLPRYYYDPEKKKRILLSIFAIIVLSSALFFIVYIRFIRPNMTVTVQTGSRKFCPVNKTYYDERIEEKKVPRKNKELYRIKTTKACPPSLIRDSAIVDLEALGKDEKAKITLERRPDWKPSAAWFAAHGKPAIGMTKRQVISAWGEPLYTEYLYKGGGIIERLYFGDPLYGMFVSNRYADFKKDALVNFSTNAELEKLYVKIMKQRREFLKRQGVAPVRAEQAER